MESAAVTKVFLFRPTSEPRDCAAVAFAQDGRELGYWISSDIHWAAHDLKRYIPDGVPSEWVIGRDAMQAKINAGEITGLSFEEPVPEESAAAPTAPGRRQGGDERG